MTSIQYVDHGARFVLVELPLVLPNASNLRGRLAHGFAATRRAKAQRDAVGWALRQPLRTSGLVDRDGGLLGPVVVRLSRLAPRSYDDDGTVCCQKHVRDEVAALLGLRSDRDPRVTWVYGHDKPLVRGNARMPGVRIEIRPREDRAA